MEWSTLLNEDRERLSATLDKHRNGFDKDYDRIIPSSSLRRLNDKTQVFPLQANDFTRTRLTHSLEVSAIGRSLGLLVADKLFDAKRINNEEKSKIPSALAVANLVHDIGNPPFGHYGEDIIRNWFRNWFTSEQYCKLVQYSETNRLSDIQKSDITNWEGNVLVII